MTHTPTLDAAARDELAALHDVQRAMHAYRRAWEDSKAELAALRALLSAFVEWDEDEDEDTPNRWDSLDTLFNSARAALAPRQTTEGHEHG